MGASYENSILLEHTEICHRLLMERLQATMFDYDVVHDVMVFERAGAPSQRRCIMEYRQKLCSRQRGAVHPDFLERLVALYLGQHVETREFLLDPAEAPQGHYAWYEVAVQPVMDDAGRVVRTVGVFWNIEARRELGGVDFSRFRSEKDPVTGILNEAGMKKDVAQYLSDQGQELSNAMLILDLRNFSALERRHGCHWGDQVLLQTAKAIRNMFRTSDTLAHLGKGRFAIFMKDVVDLTVVPHKARQLQDLFAASTELGGFGVACSVGMAVYPIEGRTCEELLQAAQQKIVD